MDAQQRMVEEARAAEQDMLNFAHDDQLMLVLDYWMFVDHNRFYKLLQFVGTQLQGYVAAHERFSPNEIKPVLPELHFGYHALTLRFYPGLVCVIATRATMHKIITARDERWKQLHGHPNLTATESLSLLFLRGNGQ